MESKGGGGTRNKGALVPNPNRSIPQPIGRKTEEEKAKAQ